MRTRWLTNWLLLTSSCLTLLESDHMVLMVVGVVVMLAVMLAVNGVVVHEMVVVL